MEIKEIPAAAPEIKRFQSRSFALITFRKKNEIEIIKNTTISCPNSIPKLKQNAAVPYFLNNLKPKQMLEMPLTSNFSLFSALVDK